MSVPVSTQYYVKASAVGNFASCEYYIKNTDGSFTAVSSPLYVPQDASSCSFLQHPESSLQLQAAVFKTLPVSSGFQDYNYACMADAEVAVPMSSKRKITKGVVLNFSNAQGTQLFASADPIIKNDET